MNSILPWLGLVVACSFALGAWAAWMPARSRGVEDGAHTTMIWILLVDDGGVVGFENIRDRVLATRGVTLTEDRTLDILKVLIKSGEVVAVLPRYSCAEPPLRHLQGPMGYRATKATIPIGDRPGAA